VPPETTPGATSSDAPASETASPANADTTATDAENSSDSAGYPANTPVAEMNAAQQAAYWKAQSRKHEQRVKSLGTPEEIRKLKADAAELEKLRQASMGEQERAVSEARAQAVQETAKEWAQRVVRSELRAATAGRVNPEDFDDLVAPMNLDWFLDADRNVDEAKIRTIAAKLASTNGAGSTGPTARFPDLGQGVRETSARPGVAAGAAAYAARKGRNTPTWQSESTKTSHG
jgi:hypothetical protein